MDVFLDALGERGRELDRAWLERLTSGVRAAPAAYPTLRVSVAEFERHVASLVPMMAPGTKPHFADLFLSFACGVGDVTALRIFEQEHMREVPAFLAKYSLDSEQLEDALQRARERLFVSDVGPPRILTYSGQGPLGGWLRMVTVRVAVDMLRQGGCELEGHEVEALGVDPELALVKARYAEDFRSAIRGALELLSNRDATLLKLRYAQNLESSKIASIYRVSPRTVQRWLVDAHEQVNRAVRKELTMNRKLDPRELSNVLGLIESQLDITLGALVRDP